MGDYLMNVNIILEIDLINEIFLSFVKFVKFKMLL